MPASRRLRSTRTSRLDGSSRSNTATHPSAKVSKPKAKPEPDPKAALREALEQDAQEDPE